MNDNKEISYTRYLIKKTIKSCLIYLEVTFNLTCLF